MSMIIGIDPSGNFNEGKGTTGICLLQSGTTNILWTDEIKAKDFNSPYGYWREHIHIINKFSTNVIKACTWKPLEHSPEDPLEIFEHELKAVSMEDYLLYADKSSAQINSKFETVQLIGLIKYHCWETNVPLAMRNAGQVKKRWSNKILEHKGYIVKCGRGWATASNPNQRISRHVLDSIRHAVHYDILESRKEL